MGGGGAAGGDGTETQLRTSKWPPFTRIMQGHPTIVFGEICVRKSQTALTISVLRCQTATDLFTKTSPERCATREK